MHCAGDTLINITAYMTPFLKFQYWEQKPFFKKSSEKFLETE